MTTEMNIDNNNRNHNHNRNNTSDVAPTVDSCTTTTTTTTASHPTTGDGTSNEGNIDMNNNKEDDTNNNNNEEEDGREILTIFSKEKDTNHEQNLEYSKEEKKEDNVTINSNNNNDNTNDHNKATCQTPLGKGVLDRQLQEVEELDGTVGCTTNRYASPLQLPPEPPTLSKQTILLNRLQDWKKQAKEVMNSTTTVTTGSTFTSAQVLEQRLPPRMQTLWKNRPTSWTSMTSSSSSTTTSTTKATAPLDPTNNSDNNLVVAHIGKDDQEEAVMKESNPPTHPQKHNDNDNHPDSKTTTMGSSTPPSTTAILSNDTNRIIGENNILFSTSSSSTSESDHTIPSSIQNSTVTNEISTPSSTPIGDLRWQWAGSTLMDSVQSTSSSVFRGRYSLSSSSLKKKNNEPSSRNPTSISGTAAAAAAAMMGIGTNTATTTTTTTTTTTSTANGASASTTTNSGGILPITLSQENQSLRIQKSTTIAVDHWQRLTSHLLPHQYILLLGRGMMGVNLKQCYRKHSGVYVDFLVPRGSADRSGVVYAGDIVVAVGDEDCTKSTIVSVPQYIAAAKRPVHLVMATSGAYDGCPIHYLNHVDICVALLVSVSQKKEKRKEPTSSSVLCQQKPTLEAGESDDSSENEMEIVQPISFDDDTNNDDDDEEDNDNNNNNTSIHPNVPIIDVTLEKNFVDAIVSPGSPPYTVSQAYQAQAAQRNTDVNYIHQHPQHDNVMVDACNPNVRAALRNAFLLCVTDRRRLLFLKRYLQNQEQGTIDEDGAHPGSHSMLLFFLDMWEYTYLWDVATTQRRYETARNIAHKFILPTSIENDFVPPMFDFHTIVPASSIRILENTMQQHPSSIPQNVFTDFQQAVLESMVDSTFFQFMIDAECARMRACLRNVAPYVNVPLNTLLQSVPNNKHSQNYFLFCLTYMVCMTDRESFGEHDDIVNIDGSLNNKGSRVVEAASGICAALFIYHKLVPVVEQVRQQTNQQSSHDPSTTQLQKLYSQLWEMFVAPGVGCLDDNLDHSEEAISCLHSVRKFLTTIQVQAKHNPNVDEIIHSLLDESLVEQIRGLADELVYDWASNIYPKFLMHKFNEWLCVEVATANNTSSTEHSECCDIIPAMSSGCIKRLLRKANFPIGVTPHKPLHHSTEPSSTSIVQNVIQNKRKQNLIRSNNAECAIVFGSIVDNIDENSISPAIPGLDQTYQLCRYTCQTVVSDIDDDDDNDVWMALTPEEVPITLETYAVAPLSRRKPFQSYSSEIWQSSDGWQVTLVHFLVPRADMSSQDGEDASLFGVSLVFQREKNDTIILHQNNISTLFVPTAKACDESCSVSFDKSSLHPKRRVSVTSEIPLFGQMYNEKSWIEEVSADHSDVKKDSPFVIGIALVSRHNVVPAMRETLSNVLHDFCQSPESVICEKTASCGALVDLLGSFYQQDVEPNSLKSILEPYIHRAAKPWLERPLGSQKDEFLSLAGKQLCSCLPPIQIALAFLTAILEQKIILSSSRRSVLFSATMALTELLKPLKWCHLLVPRVPASLAPDLLQYPAPFILGMASEDPGVTDLMRDLPDDVTLIDLDVGRVILASSFAHDNELARGMANNAETARALRTQVLFLAQSLGFVFGAQMDPTTWASDSPWSSIENLSDIAPYDRLRNITQDFVEELLAGTTACCYWVEEAQDDNTASHRIPPTVLFDEDRFFGIKNTRETDGFVSLFPKEHTTSGSQLALSLDDFDLVLELFVRCQSMNEYIGSRKRDEMFFSI